MVGMECKICLKKFCNGKALGGHMRSHYATLPLPPQRQKPSTESTSSTNEKECSAIIDSVVVVEKEKESESTRGRSAIGNGVLFDDLSTEEDVALCLVMLSRDGCRRRRRRSESVVVTRRIYKCAKCNKVFKSSQGLGSHNRSTHYKKCEFCGRRFNSAQALGDGISSFGGGTGGSHQDLFPIDLN